MWHDISFFPNSFFLLMDHCTVIKCFTSMKVCITSRAKHLWFSAAGDVLTYCMFRPPLFHVSSLYQSTSLLLGIDK